MTTYCANCLKELEQWELALPPGVVLRGSRKLDSHRARLLALLWRSHESWVSHDTISEELWGNDEPVDVGKQIRMEVCKLRRDHILPPPYQLDSAPRMLRLRTIG